MNNQTIAWVDGVRVIARPIPVLPHRTIPSVLAAAARFNEALEGGADPDAHEDRLAAYAGGLPDLLRAVFMANAVMPE